MCNFYLIFRITSGIFPPNLKGVSYKTKYFTEFYFFTQKPVHFHDNFNSFYYLCHTQRAFFSILLKYTNYLLCIFIKTKYFEMLIPY